MTTSLVSRSTVSSSTASRRLVSPDSSQHAIRLPDDAVPAELIESLARDFGPYLGRQTIVTVLHRQLAGGKSDEVAREGARQELAEILAAF